VTLFVSRVSYVFITKWLRVKKKLRQIPRIITLIYNIILYLIALMIILDHFQIKLTLLIATLGISGLAFGLAMQNALSNFFAGLYLISDKPIKVGDFIEIEKGPSGFVEDIGWRSTRIKTLSNTIIIVPNSKLAESIVINNSLPDNEIYVLIECGVSSKSDLKKVEKITNEVAKKIQRTVPGAVKNFEPFMRYHTFGDSKINFTVKLRAEKFKDRYLIIHEFIKALKERFDEEKIEIC
jgi:small-conductance mechanosensitive channel